MKKNIMILVLIWFACSMANAQIMYNIEYPPSHRNIKSTIIDDLPSIDYPIDDNGCVFAKNIGINIKEYLHLENIDGVKTARFKVGVDAISLGEISLEFKKIKLNNSAYCYVYTNDYKIVAGPIYGNSIGKQLNIVKIPAKTLIIEIVYDNLSDFDLILNNVTYQSIQQIAKEIPNPLIPVPDSCNCQHGLVTYEDFDMSVNSYCEWLGYYNYNELFRLSRLSSVNDYSLDAARSSCIIISRSESGDYIVGQATLMNFPYDTCETAFLFGARHVGALFNIVAYTDSLNRQQNLTEVDSLMYEDYLANTIIRFNWHHKYGTPWHLQNVACNVANFQLWRASIDFNEVIDYCGLRCFAYEYQPEIAILKMQQTPFYKEHHLGWTATDTFSVSVSNSKTRIVSNNDDFFILGRHNNTPTSILTNSSLIIPEQEGFSFTTSYNDSIRSWRSWSGSQLIAPDYDNGSQKIGLGIILSASSATTLTGSRYSDYFYTSNLFRILDPGPYLTPATPVITRVNMYNHYLKYYSDQLLSVPNSNKHWMPSVENREKCPSDFVGTCDFEMKDYFRTLELDGALEVHINLESLLPTDFPGNMYPKGLRIYHTKGDQETFYFDSFAGYEEIEKNITFTIDKCDMFYYQSIGLPYIELGFDFYDPTGKVLNDCQQTIRITYEPVSLCDYLVVKTDRISDSTDTCCTYTVNIDFEPCDNYSNIIYEMINSLQVKNQTTGLIEPLQAQTDINADYLAGNITFTINNVCETTDFELMASSWADSCSAKEFTLDCDAPCDSCKGITPKIRYWWGIELVDDGSTTGGLEQPTRLVREYQYAVGFIYFDSTDACPGNSFDSISVNVQCYNNLDTTFSATDIIPYGENEGYVRFDIELPPVGDSCYYVFTTITPLGPCVDSILVHHSDIAPPLRITQGENPIKLNTNSNTILQTDIKEEYDDLYIINEDGKVYKESKPVSQIDTRGLAKGRYYLIFKNKNEMVHSQEIIIQE